MATLKPIPDDPDVARATHMRLQALRVLRTLYRTQGATALEAAVDAMDGSVRDELFFLAVQLLNLALLGDAIDAYRARVDLLDELDAIAAQVT